MFAATPPQSYTDAQLRLLFKSAQFVALQLIPAATAAAAAAAMHT
jgi:hypothetical protein